MMRRTLSGIPVSPSNRPAVVVLLIFGVLWTGISAVIALFTWLFGMPLLFLTFPVLFMLIGAVMVAWCCLALFTGAKFGTLDFTVSKQSLRPGDELSVRYALPFRAGMTVERVVIRLVRRERAMFRRESNTVAALDDHVEQEVEHAGRRYQAGETASGDARFALPPDAMHSLRLQRNSVEWLVELRMPVRRLPDVHEERVLNVQPVFTAAHAVHAAQAMGRLAATA